MRSDYKNLRSGYLDNTNLQSNIRRIERFEQPPSRFPIVQNLFDNNDPVEFYVYKKTKNITTPVKVRGNLTLMTNDPIGYSIYITNLGLAYYMQDNPDEVVYYYNFTGQQVNLKDSNNNYISIVYTPKHFIYSNYNNTYNYLNYKINDLFVPVNPYSTNYRNFLKNLNETKTECSDKIILSTTMLNKDFTEPPIPNVTLSYNSNEMRTMKITTENEKIDGKTIYYINVDIPSRKKDCVGEYSEVYNPGSNMFVLTLKSVRTAKQCGGEDCQRFIPPSRNPTDEENKNRCCGYIDDGYDNITNKMKQKYNPITPTPPNCSNFMCPPTGLRDLTPEENKNRCCGYIDDGYDNTTKKMKQRYRPITPAPLNCGNFMCPTTTKQREIDTKLDCKSQTVQKYEVCVNDPKASKVKVGQVTRANWTTYEVKDLSNDSKQMSQCIPPPNAGRPIAIGVRGQNTVCGKDGEKRNLTI